MKSSHTTLSLAVVSSLVTFVAIQSSSAALLSASDNTGQSAYSDGWQNGDNGGTGFTAWTLSTSGAGTAGFYLGSSTTANSGSAPNIDVSDNSFVMYGHFSGANDSFADATRMFGAGGMLSIGDELSFALVVNFRNGAKGFNLVDSLGGTLWNFNVGGDTYKQNGTSVFGDAYSANTEFSFTFTQTGVSTLHWTIDRFGGLTGQASGDSTITAGTISGIKFYIHGTDDNSLSQNNLFFNNLSVVPVPEPANVALGIFATLVITTGVARRARRWR